MKVKQDKASGLHDVIELFELERFGGQPGMRRLLSPSFLEKTLLLLAGLSSSALLIGDRSLRYLPC